MTISERDWELLQREVDGENGGDESSALRERLAHDPELVAHYQALCGVSDALGTVRLVEPPEELTGEVMRGVRRQAFARRSGALGGLLARASARPALALAATLAVGLGAGLLVNGLSGSRLLAPVDEQSVSGALVPHGRLAALPVLDEARLDGPGIEATAVLRGGPELVVAELEIASGGGIDVKVEVDEAVWRPRGFECLGDAPAGGVVIEPGRIEVSQATAGRCFVSLTPLGDAAPGGSVPIRIALQAENGRAEATLRPQPATE